MNTESGVLTNRASKELFSPSRASAPESGSHFVFKVLRVQVTQQLLPFVFIDTGEILRLIFGLGVSLL
jgi:hypothetical protein